MKRITHTPLAPQPAPNPIYVEHVVHQFSVMLASNTILFGHIEAWAYDPWVADSVGGLFCEEDALMGIAAGYVLRRILRSSENTELPPPLTACPHCKGELTPTTDPTRRVLCLGCGWPNKRRKR